MKRNNEKGAALLLSLLIIIIIFIFSVPLINATLSTARQLKKTEADIQVMNITEMGVVYFTTAIQEAFKQVFADTTTSSQLEERYNQLQVQLAKIVPHNTVDGPNKSFEIDKIPSEKIKFNLNQVESIKVLNNELTVFLDKETYTYGVSFLTRGNLGDLNKAIVLNLKYELTSKTSDSPGSGGNGGSSLDYQIQAPKDSELSTKCGTMRSYTGEDCIYNVNQTFKEDASLSKGSTVKINGDATFIKGINKFEDSTLFVTGNVQINEKLNNVKKQGYIHIGGNLSVPIINNIEGSSRIEVKGNLTITQRINNSKGNSIIMVGGDLRIGDELNNLSDSIIVVYGNAYFTGVNNLTGTSKICVFGTLNGANSADNRIHIPSEPGFENACGMYRVKDGGGYYYDPTFNERTNTNIEYSYN